MTLVKTFRSMALSSTVMISVPIIVALALRATVILCESSRTTWWRYNLLQDIERRTHGRPFKRMPLCAHVGNGRPEKCDRGDVSPPARTIRLAPTRAMKTTTYNPRIVAESKCGCGFTCIIRASGRPLAPASEYNQRSRRKKTVAAV